MRTILLIFACWLANLAWAQNVVGPWSQNGPIAFPTNTVGQINGIGRVSQIKFHATNPQKMYAVSASGGAYVSSNNGLNWAVMPGTEILPKTACASICVDYSNDQIIYLGTGDANYYSNGLGIYKSTNGGQTFAAANATIGSKLAVEILMDPTNTNAVVAATNSGIWKTTDGATTWTQKYVGGTFTDMLANPLNKRTLYAVTKTSMFKSVDFGSTWTALTNGFVMPDPTNGGCRIAISAADTNIIYVLAEGPSGVVLKSTNAGSTFSVIYNSTTECPVCYDANPTSGSQGNYNLAFVANPQNANELFIAAHCIWRSTNGGFNWTKKTSWPFVLHTDIHQVEYNPYNNNQLFCANDGGIFVSTDTAGIAWTNRSDGITATEIYEAAQSPFIRQMISIGTQDNGELFYDGIWKTNRGGDWTTRCAFDYQTSGTTVYYLGSGKRRKLNPYSSELSYNQPFANSSNARIAFHKAQINLAFLGKDSIYRTKNLTATSPTWTLLMPTTEIVRDIHISKSDSNLVYVVTNNSKLYRSTNALATTPVWNSFTTPLSTAATASLETVPTKPAVVILSCGSKIYKSYDYGQTWTNISFNLPAVNIGKVIHDDYSINERLFVNAGIYVHYKDSTQTAWVNHSSNVNLPTIANAKNLMLFNDGTASSVLRLSTYGRGVLECAINSNLPPTVDFTANKTAICPGDSIQFSQLVTGTATSYAWSFPGGQPSTSTAANPKIAYPSVGSYNVSLTITSATGGNSITKTAYINVTNGTNTSITEGFEGSAFLPANWQQSTTNAAQWQLNYNGAFGASTKSVLFDNYNFDAGGAINYLYLPKTDLAGMLSARLTFDVAYAPFGASYPDSLLVLVSTDCGKNFTRVYQKTGTALATAPNNSSALFVPTATQWRKDTVFLNAYANQSIIVAFGNVGYYGQGIYLDNVQLQLGVTANFVANDTAVCIGDAITFTNNSVNQTTNSWNFPGATPATSSAVNPTVSYANSGLYTVSLATANVLGTNSKVKTNYILVYNKPTLSITSNGSTLTASGAGIVSYQWFKNNTLIPGATNATYANASNGSFKVQYTDVNGCTYMSSNYELVLGIPNVDICPITVSPNPAHQLVQLQTNKVAYNNVQVEVYNAQGGLVYKHIFEHLNNQTGFIYCNDWPTGLYDFVFYANNIYLGAQKILKN